MWGEGTRFRFGTQNRQQWRHRCPPSSRRFSLSADSFLVRSGVSPSAVARSVQVAVLGQKLAASALQAGRGGVPARGEGECWGQGFSFGEGLLDCSDIRIAA